MYTSTYRHTAAAEPSRNGAANQPHLFLHSTSQTKSADRLPLPFDRDAFLERASRRMSCYFSEEELSQLRTRYAFLIERIKKRIKKYFVGKQKWRKVLFQDFRSGQVLT